MDLQKVETELKKRLKYPYKWGVKQNDYMDYLTSFIYHEKTFDGLLAELKKFQNDKDFKNLFYYSLNRWYNFLSSQAVEFIFCSNQYVVPAIDSKDKLKDFQINEINFDLKSSVFPKGMNKNHDYMLSNKREVIEWLYENQSRQGRKHFKNRLFIILYDKAGDHWKLKSEILWLKILIEDYLKNFDKNNLEIFNFGEGEVLSDIIWAIKE